jgi:hypothetical protein
MQAEVVCGESALQLGHCETPLIHDEEGVDVQHQPVTCKLGREGSDLE